MSLRAGSLFLTPKLQTPGPVGVQRPRLMTVFLASRAAFSEAGEGSVSASVATVVDNVSEANKAGMGKCILALQKCVSQSVFGNTRCTE